METIFTNNSKLVFDHQWGPPWVNFLLYQILNLIIQNWFGGPTPPPPPPPKFKILNLEIQNWFVGRAQGRVGPLHHHHHHQVQNFEIIQNWFVGPSHHPPSSKLRKLKIF